MLIGNVLCQWNEENREWKFEPQTRYLFSFNHNPNELIIKTVIGMFNAKNKI